MAAVHIPLLLTLPDLSDMSHPSLPSLLTPHQESSPNGLLKQRQFPKKLLSPWKLVFQISLQKENLELCLLSLQEQKMGTPGWTTGTPLPVLSSGMNTTRRRLRNLTKWSLCFLRFVAQEIPKPWAASLCLRLLTWIFSAAGRLFQPFADSATSFSPQLNR